MSEKPIPKLQKYTNLEIEQIDLRDMHSRKEMRCEPNGVYHIATNPIYGKAKIETNEVGGRGGCL